MCMYMLQHVRHSFCCHATSAAALSLLNGPTQFQYVAAFVIVSKVMLHLQSLAAALQERAIDDVKAYGLVDKVVPRLRRLT